MEELRQSIRMREEETLEAKKALLEEALKKLGLSQTSNFSRELEFVQTISSDQNHILWQIFTNAYQSQTKIILSYQDFKSQGLIEQTRVKEFLDECMLALKRFHLEVCDLDFNQAFANQNLKQLKDQLTYLEKNPDLIKGSDKSMNISYVKDKAYITKIFDYYKIKYKVTIQNELLSIYPENDQKICSIPIDSKTKIIKFIIQGSRIPRLDEEQQSVPQGFQTISQIELPFKEILSAIQPKFFSDQLIKPCYLVLSYQDETPNPPYKNENQFEIKFDLRIGQLERIEIIKELIKYYNSQDQAIKNELKQILERINQVILPFSNHVQYVVPQGICLKKKENARACEGCHIF